MEKEEDPVRDKLKMLLNNGLFYFFFFFPSQGSAQMVNKKCLQRDVPPGSFNRNFLLCK